MGNSGDPLLAEKEIDSELVIGLVAAVGTEISLVVSCLETELSRAGYEAVHIKVSSDVIPNLENVSTDGEAEYERIDRLMTAGNRARHAASVKSENEDVGNAILAYGAAAQIFAKRKTQSDGKRIPFTRKAFIIDSLKRPEEVETLRRIYPQGFILIGVDSAKSRRLEHLTETLQISACDAINLMSRDENEATESHGQRVSKSFHLADFFVRLTNSDALRCEIRRMVELWFGCPTHTPTFDEFAMFLAFSAALRSGDLSRQVGAVVAIDNQVISTGANDSPRAGGGLYWPSRDVNGEFQDDQFLTSTWKCKRVIISMICCLPKHNWRRLMTKSEFQKKLDEASKIVESWPAWKKNSLKESFRSRNSSPRDEVVLRAQSMPDKSSTNS